MQGIPFFSICRTLYRWHRLCRSEYGLSHAVPSDVLVAARKGDLEKVERLLAAGRDFAVPQDLLVATLLRAGYTGRAQLVDLLLDKGVDVNAADEAGNTALICAAKNGHPNVVKLLLCRGADANAEDYGVERLP